MHAAERGACLHDASARASTRAPCVCSVLEIGCGSGFAICSVALMLRQLGVQAQMCAIDHSAHALEATTATLCNHDVSGNYMLACPAISAEFYMPS